MKKILFLLLICLIKLNAYEYIFYNNENTSYDTQVKSAFFVDNNGNFLLRLYHDNNVSYSKYINRVWFSCIKFNYSDSAGKYISDSQFKSYYENDLKFLNDLYTSNSHNLNGFLNYLYNDSRFNDSSFVEYENYKILYNNEGYAVESIVGGVWKGLYDTPENSGFLYDRKNNILYKNGEVASLFQRFWYALTGNVSKTLKLYYISMLGLNIFILIVAVYLVKVILGLIIKWISTIINNTKVNVNLGAQKRW